MARPLGSPVHDKTLAIVIFALQLFTTIVAVPIRAATKISFPQFCVCDPALLQVVNPLNPVPPKLGIASDSQLGEGKILSSCTMHYHSNSARLAAIKYRRQCQQCCASSCGLRSTISVAGQLIYLPTRHIHA